MATDIMRKSTLKNQVWERDEYYNLIDNIKLTWDQPGMHQLEVCAKKSRNILDIGCGEGSRLLKLQEKTSSNLSGIDISENAIKRAKKKVNGANFVVGDLEKLPFKDSEFDLIYSFFVFEHLTNPEKVIGEIKRVLSVDGVFITVCPNYGSPNRSSPPFVGSRIRKLLVGLIKDFELLTKRRLRNLNWNKVKPIATKNEYYVDWDTTIEPYVVTFVKYLSHLGFETKVVSSSWYAVDNNEKIHQRIFKILGQCGIYPFKYWGPQIEIVAQKR